MEKYLFSSLFISLLILEITSKSASKTLVTNTKLVHGLCPHDIGLHVCFFNRGYVCESDYQCPEGYKCCPTTCGKNVCKKAKKAIKDTVERPLQCWVELEEGDCKKSWIRYYYDAETKQCRKFFYKGCGGNSNRFKTIEECRRKCLVGESGIIDSKKEKIISSSRNKIAKTRSSRKFHTSVSGKIKRLRGIDIKEARKQTESSSADKKSVNRKKIRRPNVSRGFRTTVSGRGSSRKRIKVSPRRKVVPKRTRVSSRVRVSPRTKITPTRSKQSSPSRVSSRRGSSGKTQTWRPSRNTIRKRPKSSSGVTGRSSTGNKGRPMRQGVVLISKGEFRRQRLPSGRKDKRRPVTPISRNTKKPTTGTRRRTSKLKDKLKRKKSPNRKIPTLTTKDRKVPSAPTISRRKTRIFRVSKSRPQPPGVFLIKEGTDSIKPFVVSDEVIEDLKPTRFTFTGPWSIPSGVVRRVKKTRKRPSGVVRRVKKIKMPSSSVRRERLMKKTSGVLRRERKLGQMSSRVVPRVKKWKRRPSVCDIRGDKSRCSQVTKTYYYDPDKMKCYSFYYRGCKTPSAILRSMSDCLTVCSI